MIRSSGLRFAFFDDYADERGHHPDLILGLGEASGAHIYCPDSFLDGGIPLRIAAHHPMVGAPGGSPDVTRANLEACCGDARASGCEVLVNLFIDENWDSFPIPRERLPIVHTLHRPGELTGLLGGTNAAKPFAAVAAIAKLAQTDPLIVHTHTAERQARAMFPAANVVHLGWPAAHRDEIVARFAAAAALNASGDADEPYVLLVGEALKYKGIELLLAALSPGPRLKIGGYPTYGGPGWIAASFPQARVSWEPGWVTRDRMAELISGAAVVVFPYLPEFAEHGGASGALVHALTFAKPIVMSEALTAQSPSAEACLVVPANDVETLRKTVLAAVERRNELTAAALDLRDHVLTEHSYESHVSRLSDWFASHG